LSYRPITDVWILARPKVKYYGAYPNGFLERALPMIGASDQDPVLHLCGGCVHDYPNKRLVRNALTVDSDTDLHADHHADLCQEVDDDWPTLLAFGPSGKGWASILIDPPYTDADHEKYLAGKADCDRVKLPTANHLLRLGLKLAKPGGKVGVLHYVWPQPPKTARSIACIGVIVGFNNRMRCFSVFERAV
jgi:hypothetical protein